MNRRTFTASALAFALHPTLHAQSSADSDLHALYTAILIDWLQVSCPNSSGWCETPNGPCRCYDWKKERLLIRNVTFPLTPADRARLTNLPLHRETYPPGPTPPWQRPLTYDTRVPAELLEAFDATRQQPISLPGPFELPVPSQMATEEDAKGFGETHSMILFGITSSTPKEEIEHHDQQEAKYGRFTAYIQLSTATFNPSRTLALATLRWHTGSDSEIPDMVYTFEKFEGQWRRYVTPVGIGLVL